MKNQRGFISVLIAILVGLAVLGGGAYYVVQQQTPTQTTTENFDNLQKLPTNPTTSIMFTSPDKGDVLKTGSVYTARWTGQSNSDQAQVTLKATDPSCWNVGLVAEGERGCSAIELGKAKLSDGSFQLRLQPGVSPLLPVVEWNGPLAARDSKTKYVLFFDVPSGRITSPEFTVQGNDFVITPTIEKFQFTPGETVRFSVRGIADTGGALSPELGFSAKVFLEWGDNWGSGGSAIYREGTYNQTTKQWDFVTTAPTTPKNDYRIFLYVKCSNQNLCAQRYAMPLEKDALLKFNVSQADSFSASPLSGKVPLVVTFTGLGLKGQVLQFGDASESKVTFTCTGQKGSEQCVSNSITHTYVTTGTYTAKLVEYKGSCELCMDRVPYVIASATITVL